MRQRSTVVGCKLGKPLPSGSCWDHISTVLGEKTPKGSECYQRVEVWSSGLVKYII